MGTVAATRQHIKTVLSSIVGLTGSRIILGEDDIPADEEFFTEIVSAGPKILISPAEWGDQDMQTRVFNFSVELKIWTGFPADADANYVAPENLIESIYSTLGDPENWQVANVSHPWMGFSAGKPETVNPKPRVIVYTLPLQFESGIEYE